MSTRPASPAKQQSDVHLSVADSGNASTSPHTPIGSDASEQDVVKFREWQKEIRMGEDMSIQGKATQYGFQWGPAKIERACSDEKKGWVVMLLETPKAKLQIYVTKTGKVRVHDVSGRGARELKALPE